MVVADGHAPATIRGRPGHGDVAAEIDHDPAAERLAYPPCGAVSGQRFGGCAQVELNAGHNAQYFDLKAGTGGRSPNKFGEAR